MGEIKDLLNGKLTIEQACDLVWQYFKGTPFEQIQNDCSNLDRDYLHSILLGAKGVRLREKVRKIWDMRNKIYKDGITVGEHFEKKYLGWKKGEKK